MPRTTRVVKDGDRPLTDQQRAFVKAYISMPVDVRDPEAAALTAGYSAKTSASQGRRLLTDPRVQREILRFHEGVVELAKIDAAWLLNELANVWQTPLRRLFDDQGRLKPIHELDDQAQRLIAGFEITELTSYSQDGKTAVTTRTGKIKLVDRLRVLDRIGEHVDVNAFGSREKADANESLAALMRAATKAIQMSHNTVPVEGRRTD